MVRCWTVNPEIRPTFRQLCEDLTTMAKEPHRFIVISNVFFFCFYHNFINIKNRLLQQKCIKNLSSKPFLKPFANRITFFLSGLYTTLYLSYQELI